MTPLARARLARAVAPWLFFTVATVWFTYPQARHLATAAPPHIDPLFSTWRLAWIAHQLAIAPSRLFDANIFYPKRWTLAYSDPILLPGVLSAPLQWAGLGALTVYNLLVLAAFVLSGVSAHYLVKQLTGSTGAGLVSGVAFAFAPFRMLHYVHLELLAAWWIPLALLVVHHALERPNWRHAAAFAGCLAGQVLSGVYYAVYFVATMAVVLPVALWARRAAVRSVIPVLVGLALATILVWPYAEQFRRARSSVGERSLDEVARYSARPVDFVTVPPTNRLYGARLVAASDDERALFPGVLPVVLAVVGIAIGRRRERWVYVAVLALASEAALGTNGLVYPWLFEHVGPFRGLRVPARMGMLVSLGVSVLAGYGVAAVLARAGSMRRRALITVFLLGGLSIELASNLPMRPLAPPNELLCDWLNAQPGRVVAEFPVTTPDRLGEIPDTLYMYNSTCHWKSMVNGYSGFFPLPYIDFLEAVRGFPDDRAIEYLQRSRVDYVIVHARPYGRAKFEAAVAGLDMRHDLEVAGHFSDVEGTEVRIYRWRDAAARRDAPERPVATTGTGTVGSAR